MFKHGVGDNIRQSFRHGGHSNEWYVVEAQVTLACGIRGYVVSAHGNRENIFWLSEYEAHGIESFRR